MESKEKGSIYFVKSIWYKYVLLMIIGFVIILCSNFFLQKTAVAGEYHYSQLLREVYQTPFVIMFFCITGFGAGYFWKMNPWFNGLFLYAIFPLTSIIEAIVYRGSHNLIPFEFLMFLVYAIPAVVAVYLGRLIREKSQNHNKQ